MAWEIFREKNGTDSFGTLYATIDSLRSRGPGNSLDMNPVIGCCVLTNPVFFDVSDRVEIPEWKSNIVQGRYFDTSETDGERIWQAVEATLEKYLINHQNEGLKNQLILEEPNSIYSKKILVNVRMGQSAFRVLVTDAYNRKCSISGERTLPVLEAAHIKPYATSGPSYISNGILLRSDLHKLFDSGYITITTEYKVEVSNKIREEFENGREYYRFHGQPLSTLPSKQDYEPSKPYLEWHNLNVFKA
jgi:putative restriction endonuclease